jgi:hypothetical protein
MVSFFIPKIPIWVFFGGSWNGKCCYIFWPCGILYDHWYILWAFGHFVLIWYIFPSFGTLFQEKSGNPGLGAAICISKRSVHFQSKNYAMIF